MSVSCPCLHRLYTLGRGDTPWRIGGWFAETLDTPPPSLLDRTNFTVLEPDQAKNTVRGASEAQLAAAALYGLNVWHELDPSIARWLAGLPETLPPWYKLSPPGLEKLLTPEQLQKIALLASQSGAGAKQYLGLSLQLRHHFASQETGSPQPPLDLVDPWCSLSPGIIQHVQEVLSLQLCWFTGCNEAPSYHAWVHGESRLAGHLLSESESWHACPPGGTGHP